MALLRYLIMDKSPFLITITIDSQKWNRAGLAQIINYLTEQKGGCDRFELVIDGVTIPFPNHTTHYSIEMIRNLLRLFESEDAVNVRPLLVMSDPTSAQPIQLESKPEESAPSPLATMPMTLFDMGRVEVSSYEAGL